MIEKLRTLKPGTWYSLTNRPDRDQLLTTIETLIDEGVNKGVSFELSPDKNSFRVNEMTLWSLLGQPGYTVEKIGTYGERLFFQGREISSRSIR